MNEQLLKYFFGELSQSEQTDLLKQVQSDKSLQQEFIRLQNTLALSQLSKHAANYAEGEKSYRLFVRKISKQKQNIQFKNVLKYAAVAVILIASTVFLTHYIGMQHAETAMNTLYVPPGQRAKLTLQDGTVIWLNAQSTLIYPARFSGKERKVAIVGEAFFDVAKKSAQPFVVSTKGVEIKVLGTRFNVHCYESTDYVQTDLIEGSLKIVKTKSDQQGTILEPNQQATVRNGNISVKTIANSDYYLWRDGIYSFENERLLNIIEKFQLYYDVKIIVQDPEIFNVKYTGKFRQRDGIDEILRMIQKIHRFNIFKDNEKNIITLTK